MALFNHQSRRRVPARLGLVAVLVVFASMLFTITASGAPLAGSKFEADDGNLRRNVTSPPPEDWNSFRDALPAAGAFDFMQRMDGAAVATDVIFASGKHDDDCPTLTQNKALNKGDFTRFYIANHEGTNGHEFVEMAWARIPQNSTTASGHASFIFAQSDTSCGNTLASHSTPVRLAGDMLVLFDFEGGTAAPVLKLSRYLTSASEVNGNPATNANCETGNETLPCWGDLVTLPPTQAIGAVNTINVPGEGGRPAGTVLDQIADPDVYRGPVEFGEAEIDLTAAGVFDPNECVNFGRAYVGSRSSGNSFDSSMKDLVRPLDVNISNCGRAIVKKTDATNGNPIAGASFDIVKASDVSGGTYDPDDATAMTEVADGIFCTDSLLAGSYKVFETAPPPNYELDGTNPRDLTVVENSGSCQGVSGTSTPDTTFANQPQRGSIAFEKVDENGARLDGATFTITGGGLTDAPVPNVENGWYCIDNLLFGSYTITETASPAGYQPVGPSNASVSTVSSCADKQDPDGDDDLTDLGPIQNQPAPGTINITKTDDDDLPLDGVGFSLFVDADEVGTYDEDDDQQVGSEVFTDGGAAQFAQVPLGTYCVVETTPLAGYTAADPQCGIVVSHGTAPSAGDADNLTFVNPQQHKIVVVVCHEGTGTLAASDVTDAAPDPDETITTLDAGDLTEAQQTLVCGLQGFSGRSHDDVDLTVSPGSDAAVHD